MGSYFLDRVLPGLITGVVMSAGTWLSHRKLRRHITYLTGKQTAQTRQLAAEQAGTPTAKGNPR